MGSGSAGFGGRQEILGQTVSIGNGTYTVIGVAPKGFNGVDWLAARTLPPHSRLHHPTGSDRWVAHRGYYWLQILGRLAPSSSREAAAEEATALHLNGRREFIDQGRYPEDARVVLGSVQAALGPDAPEEVQVSRWLVGVTLIVLLIACANVANLLLARGARRRRELGIRVALGISRRRLVGQLFLESMVLAGVGGAVGLAMAYWGGRYPPCRLPSRRCLAHLSGEPPGAPLHPGLAVPPGFWPVWLRPGGGRREGRRIP